MSSPGSVKTSISPVTNPQSSSRKKRAQYQSAAFSLVELLAVIAIASVMITLVAPALINMKGGSDFTTSLYDVAGTLEQARAYAMANHTHVFVGFEEVNADIASSASPQVAATSTKGGALAIAIIASKDGTRQYNVPVTTAWSAPSLVSTAMSAGFSQVGKVQRFENVHLADFSSAASVTDPNSGMHLSETALPAYTIGNPNNGAGNSTATPFSIPLSASSGKSQYSFNQVIEFDSQGTARMVSTANGDEIVKVIEIDLQPTHGSIIPPKPGTKTSNNTTGSLAVGNQAAIQIDGLTGATHIYRP